MMNVMMPPLRSPAFAALVDVLGICVIGISLINTKVYTR